MLITPTADIRHDIDFETELAAALDAFLLDPIGYGDYDYDDPITLEEFVTARPMRGRYCDPLAY